MLFTTSIRGITLSLDTCSIVVLRVVSAESTFLVFSLLHRLFAALESSREQYSNCLTGSRRRMCSSRRATALFFLKELARSVMTNKTLGLPACSHLNICHCPIIKYTHYCNKTQTHKHLIEDNVAKEKSPTDWNWRRHAIILSGQRA